MIKKISGVYKITNIITGDFYIGSSNDVKRRWTAHKSPSRWRRCSNNPLYLDFQKYGVDKFEFQILEEAESEHLKEAEQKLIEKFKPTYNSNNANGWNIERHNKYQKEYYRQLCCYNGETIALGALKRRFQRDGVEHPAKEAKKYLLTNHKVK